jgi:uracil-DNA glycosylase family 4
MFRTKNESEHSDFYNGAVPSFGALDASLLVVGLAPGLKGANRTGRPFTGDYAGDVLYPALVRHGFAAGQYGAHPEDGLALNDTRITNAVRCVPPENKPEPLEIRTCNRFLAQEIAAMPRLRVVLALGGIAHKAALSAFGLKAGYAPFMHGGETLLPSGATLISSYHSSRYNINTGRLTLAMFDVVMQTIQRKITSNA